MSADYCPDCGADPRRKENLERHPGAGEENMPKKRPEIRYHYRGGIERGARYEWRDGYSETTPDGGILYPWMTRAECRRDAIKQGCRAIFYRDGTPE